MNLKFTLDVFNNDDDFIAESINLGINSDDVLKMFGFDPRTTPGDLELTSEEDIRKLDSNIKIDFVRYSYGLGVWAGES